MCEQLKSHPEDANSNLNRVGAFALNMAGPVVFFQKAVKYRHQAEYRWVWLTSQPIQDLIIVHVPNARAVCSPWFKT